MRKLFAAISTVVLSAASTSALAYRPVERPFPSTPERFPAAIIGSASAAIEARLAPLGLATRVKRRDGTPLLLAGTSRAKPAAGAIATHAGKLSAALAPLFGESAESLTFARETSIGDLTVVSFAQNDRGILVDGGFLILTYKAGTIAKVVNELVSARPKNIHPRLTREDAEALALQNAAQISADAALDPQTQSRLEIWSDNRSARLAWRIKTKTISPKSVLLFHLDAETGAVLAADDTIRYADGEGRVRFLVDEVHTDSPEVPMTVPSLLLANNIYTDGDGETLQTTRRTITYEAKTAAVSDQTGAALEELELDFGGAYKNYDLAPQNLSQADPFVHLLVVQAWARALTPNLGWLNSQLQINVNISDTCNAYWDGYSVNFFRSGGGCTNTGRVSSVVYHEFGHGYHQNLTDNVVGSVGEGTGDYIAATILDTPLMGVGFFDGGQPMRRLDRNNAYPEDYIGEVHEDGLIWAGAMWDLRVALVGKFGPSEGARTADLLFTRAVAQGPRLGTSYAALLAADDDDNDPSNGTPNSCEINAAFDSHGLINSGQIQNEVAGTRAFIVIRHEAPGRIALAPGANTVRIEAEPVNVSSCGTFSADDLVLYFAPGSEGGSYQRVPLLADGTKRYAELGNLNFGDTFRYYFEHTSGAQIFRNGSPASPHLALAGDYLEAANEGFEAGFGAWTHGSLGATPELRDDWEVGAPAALASDPEAARFGANAVGTDLGSGLRSGSSNGAAKYSRGSYLESPASSTLNLENLRVELWHSAAIAGRLSIKANGTEVWSFTGTADQNTEGWRYLTVPLDAALNNLETGVVLRFEVEASAENRLGGWTLDQVALIGTQIPKAPEEPPPPVDPPGMEEPPPIDPPPGMENPPMMEPPALDPQNPETMNPNPGGDLRPQGAIGSGCVCSDIEQGTRSTPPSSWSLGGLLALYYLARITRRGRP